MAGGIAVVSDQLGIVELSGVCAAMHARSLALFSMLGGWVTTTRPGELQRMFAEACHRHAWHAELWHARTPVIRVVVVAPNEPAAVPATADDGERSDLYRDALSALDEELQRLRARVDPVLDPSTARTVDLVGRDVVELAGRVDALRTR